VSAWACLDQTSQLDLDGIRFYIAIQPGEWQTVAEIVDGRILSTPLAGGFVGAYLGLHASSNGQPSTNQADFDCFEYLGLDES